ncbi:hypothetical protein Hoch_5703 [Haliangium ochraceum DSM 14365]|uniref:Uncharacterized protein n=1 Tax=Haliangium ochraceum (strain DSM 14365 / JCM 11303 / SMP-2) TaxID=502025 RepID=D0LH35_HALO1|nr:hypothetical protein Hoch_5703 [Haliangium ochraceum DSM 14365]
MTVPAKHPPSRARATAAAPAPLTGRGLALASALLVAACTGSARPPAHAPTSAAPASASDADLAGDVRSADADAVVDGDSDAASAGERARPLPAPLEPAPARRTPHGIVVVAAVLGDADGALRAHLLRALHELARAPDAGLRILDLPDADVVVPIAAGADAADADAGDLHAHYERFAAGHARARALLDENRASALVWGLPGPAGGAAGAEGSDSDTRPTLYLTTSDASQQRCSAVASTATDPGPAQTSILCALESGATWALCASAWAAHLPSLCSAP